MADDCVCTNLIAIHSVLSDIALSLKYGNVGIASINNNQLRQMVNSISTLTTSIGTLNDVVSKLDDIFKCNNVSLACIMNNTLFSNEYGVPYLRYLTTIHNDLVSLGLKFEYDNKNIAEIWSYKEMCVSNETIVESPLSTFVSKAKLEIDE